MSLILLLWLALTNVLAFGLFAWDKLNAGTPGRRRVSEFALLLMAVIGGWPGGLLSMLCFRHKTAKLSFQLKYAAALIVWTGLLYAALNWS